jgi:hypothetical protein
LRRSLALVAMLGFALGGRGVAEGVAEEAREYEVKAALLYKFTQYIEWPAEAFERKDSPLLVAVIGKDPFGRILDETLRDKKCGEHPFAIKRFASAKEIDAAHVLFVPGAEAVVLAEILKALGGRSTLIVGESEGFASKGGIVNFYLEKSKTRFEINPDAAKRCKLKISSDLLKVARIVKGESEKSPRGPAAGDDVR